MRPPFAPIEALPGETWRLSRQLGLTPMAVFKLIVTESGLLSDSEAEKAGTFLLTTLPALIDTLKSISREIADATLQAKKRVCCFPR